jgi:hypothetical protein
MIVLLRIQADIQRAARLIINDPLPAGREIDNPNLIAAGSVEGLSWLDVGEQPADVAFRAERFVAAVDRERGEPREFQPAYPVPVSGKPSENFVPSAQTRFFGITIQMFWREHAPPHFHALYGEHEALIDIRTLEIIGDTFPNEHLR